MSEAAPIYEVGDRVRILDIGKPGHVRTPTYVRHKIGTIESGQTSQTLLIVRIDVFARLVQSKHHRTVEAVMLAENLAQHGESLF